MASCLSLHAKGILKDRKNVWDLNVSLLHILAQLPMWLMLIAIATGKCLMIVIQPIIHVGDAKEGCRNCDIPLLYYWVTAVEIRQAHPFSEQDT